jgi:hypothetical protein
MSWEHYIEVEANITDEVLKDYFKFKYRGRFYSEMKSCAIHYLKEKGYKHREVAEIVYGSCFRHDAVIHHLKNGLDIISSDVRDHWQFWIVDKLYPISQTKTIQRKPKNDYESSMSYVRGHYIETVTTYNLKNEAV